MKTMKDKKLTPSETLALVLIHKLEGEHASYQQMADLMGVSRATFGSVLQRLKSRGLVELIKAGRYPMRKLTRQGRIKCAGFL